MSGRADLPALLEREAALQQVALCLEQARRGHGRVLLVAGEAGIGKSTLVHHVAAAAGARWRIAWGPCEDLHAPRPLGPLRDIASQAGPALDRVRHAAGADAVELFEIVRDWLDTPAVCSIVVLEDVHWADQATLDFVKYLGRRIASLPVLLVLTYRSEEVDARHPLQRVLGDLPPAVVAALELAPLSPQGVQALARAAGRAGGPSAQRLHAITAGNPFFVTELLAGDGELPTSVRAAVLARLARLPPAAREVADTASVLPGGAEWWLLRALLPDVPPVEFDTCVARGVLVATADGLAFRHELARRAALDALPPARRAEGHRRVLAALRTPPAGLHVSASRAAHHAAAAADAAQVLLLAPQAAREAAAVGAHREAAQQYALALRFADAAPPELAAQLHESWSYEAGLAMGIDDAVIQARERAVALWRALQRHDKVGDNLRWLSRLHWYRGDAATSERYADEAVATLERAAAGPELAWAYALRAQTCMLQNRTDGALDWGQRADALQVAQQVLDRPGLALVMRLPALTVRARAGVRRGDPKARAWLLEAHAAARDTGEVQRRVPLVLALAEDAWLRDDLQAAAAALETLGAADAQGLGAWERGELAVWRRRCRLPELAPDTVAAPWQLELQGQPAAAAAAWRERSAPVEAAFALLQAALAQPDAALGPLRDALAAFEAVGAGPGARRTRALAGVLGLQRQLPGRRGPYRAARGDPDGLTAREQRVLLALADGLANEAIAAQLGVSRRTVERHVSQVLAKLGVASRAEAARHARRRAP